MAGLVFLLVFWVLAGACQRHGVGGFLLCNTTTTSATSFLLTSFWVSVVVNLKICCELGDVPHTSPEMRIWHESCIKNVEPSGRLFQVQTTSEPAAARAISRRTRFEGEASADEAYSPGSGAVQVSGRWKRAILCPTTRPVRKTHKPG